MASRWSVAPTPATEPPGAPSVVLDPFYVVVDRASYEALQAWPLTASELASFERRTTARSDRTYSGMYWYGWRTSPS